MTICGALIIVGMVLLAWLFLRIPHDKDDDHEH